MNIQDIFEKNNPIPKGVERCYNHYVPSNPIPDRGDEIIAELYQARWEGYEDAMIFHGHGMELADNSAFHNLTPVRLIGGSKQGITLFLAQGVTKIQFGDEVYKISVMAGKNYGAGKFYSGNWLAGHIIRPKQEEEESKDG